jgi:hypothetical protein
MEGAAAEKYAAAGDITAYNQSYAITHLLRMLACVRSAMWPSESAYSNQHLQQGVAPLSIQFPLHR